MSSYRGNLYLKSSEMVYHIRVVEFFSSDLFIRSGLSGGRSRPFARGKPKVLGRVRREARSAQTARLSNRASGSTSRAVKHHKRSAWLRWLRHDPYACSGAPDRSHGVAQSPPRRPSSVSLSCGEDAPRRPRASRIPHTGARGFLSRCGLNPTCSMSLSPSHAGDGKHLQSAL